MLYEKDVIRAVISFVVALILSALLHRFVKMSHLMGKFVIPSLLFLTSFYLLREFWQDNNSLEEGLSPQFLSYGHTNFNNSDQNEEVEKDDPDSTQQFLPQDHPLYSELTVPRQNEYDPEAFNANNINVSYAYLNSGSSSDTYPQQPTPKPAPQNQACAVGGPLGGLCSRPNVEIYNPNNLVAPTPSPIWAPERAAEVQERLNKGDYVPTTSMM